MGALGALNRVYLNIGLFSEEWLLHFRALVGGKPISPIEIAVAEKNSAYWEATEAQTPDMALFFLKSTAPHLLKDAPGGDAYLTKDKAKLERGKIVFAERCARCHSSKIPEGAPGMDAGRAAREKTTWIAGTSIGRGRRRMTSRRRCAPWFRNPTSSTTTIFRPTCACPSRLLQTNACSPLATNAIADNIWDNFSSHTYKDLPSVGTVTWYHPVTGEARSYQMPAGGRGYTRPASLISAWSTAPFLLNNAVGKFNPSPSVAARMDSFQDSIEKMLWPEKREKDPVLGDKVPGVIDRTTQASYLRIPSGYLPDVLRPLMSPGQRFFPWLFGDDGVVIGPIPAGTPVDLLANIDILGETTDVQDKLAHQKKVLELLLKMKHDLEALPKGASDEEARSVFANLVDPMLEVSKCPDFVVNRGHYFGTSYFKEEPALSDDDKRALIEYIKTF